MRLVSSWGRLTAHPHRVVSLNDPTKDKDLVSSGTDPGVA